MPFHPGFVGKGISGPTIVGVHSSYIDDSGTGYQYNNVALGAAASNRDIIVVVGGGTSGYPEVSSVTIAGISATINANRDNMSPLGAIAKARVTSGTSGTVVVNLSGTCNWSAIAVFRVIGLASSTPDDTDVTAEDNSTPLSITRTLTVVSPGIVVAGAYYTADTKERYFTAACRAITGETSHDVTIAASGGNATWTGLDEYADLTGHTGTGNTIEMRPYLASYH